MASKYDLLKDYLADQAKKGQKEVFLDISFIEQKLGVKLPESAKTNKPNGKGYRAWWGNEDVNNTTHGQCRSWLDAGYLVNGEKSDFDNGSICFEMY